MDDKMQNYVLWHRKWLQIYCRVLPLQKLMQDKILKPETIRNILMKQNKQDTLKH